MITFGSVCSGIEAASVAWHPLGWRAAWLAEIEAAPSQALAHHYPDVPNLGDMNLIPGLLRNGDLQPPDVLCGGTPCQAFSVAGLRNSLDDARGNLSLKFCDIADEIDIQRSATGLFPATVVWENVPGVLSTKDNAFGCFLGQLAGEDCALVPPGGKWTNAGAVFGPKRAIAWRVFDAQYFGLAQRRRRVFVVASARNGFDPAAVLFEFEGVRRDSAPRREPGKDLTHDLAPCLTSSGRGIERTGDTRGQDPVVAVEITGALTASYGEQSGRDLAEMPGGLQLVKAFGGNRTSGEIEITPALLAQGGSGWKGDFESETFLVQPAPIAFDSRQECVSSTEVFGALGSSSPQAQAVCITGDITHTLKAEGFDASEDGTGRGRGQPIVAAFTSKGNGEVYESEVTNALCAAGGGQAGQGYMAARVGMAVRRLMPIECERLQGFPDGYTAIPLPERRQGATGMRVMADGPRYKALGNSWAVPNVRWIGRRIDQHLRDLDEIDNKNRKAS